MQGPAAFNNIVANTVVIGGTAGGLFIYQGTPGAGNAPIAWSAPPGTTTDPYGNILPLNGGFITEALSTIAALVNGKAQFFTTTFPPANNAIIGIGGSSSNSQTLELSSGNISSDTAAIINLISDTVMPQAFAQIGQLLVTPNGTGAVSTDALEIQGNATFQGDIRFSTPSGISNWTNITLVNGWANGAGNVVAKYQRITSPPNSVEIIGAISSAAATNIKFGSIPFTPNSQQGIAAGASGNVAANMAPYVQCDTAGNLTMNSAAALPGNGNFRFHGTISLDA